MIDFNPDNEVKIILTRNRVAKVPGFESHTRGHSIRIKFDDGHEMLTPEKEILLADDPELDRIRTVYHNLMQRGYPQVLSHLH